MHTILHITPHLGGGVGRVLLNYLSAVCGAPDFTHRVICLDYANSSALAAARTAGFSLRDKMAGDPEGIFAELAAADVVLVHWWNHPLLYAFLVRETLPPVRLLFWSHISGFNAPYVFTKSLLGYPDLFVLTTPVSMEAQEIRGLPEDRKKAMRVIWSTGGLRHAEAVEPKSHEGFVVGYIGTVDYCKLHPDFMKLCSGIRIPDVRFTVCGGPCEKEMQAESVQAGLSDKMTFTGQVDDISHYLSGFDVFGYPLNPDHYGTCDQALAESMAAGVPPVVLSNRMEQYMVENGVTGIVAGNEEEYARSVEELYKRPELRKKLSVNAREFARQRFSIERMISQWEDVFSEALSIPKTVRRWAGRFSGKSASPAQIFVESLGDCGDAFMHSMNAQNQADKDAAENDIRSLYVSSCLWRSNTRGTPRHYLCFFPEDENIRRWSDLVRDGIQLIDVKGKG